MKDFTEEFNIIDMFPTQKNFHSKINDLTLRPVFDISIDPGSVIG